MRRECARLTTARLAMLFAWLSVAMNAAAQVATATVTGVVKDHSGGVIAGARIDITKLDTLVVYATIANRDGIFTVPALPPGTYRVDVSFAGFAQVRREPVRLATGSTLRVDIVLQLAGVPEQVSVTRDLHGLRSERAALGTTVDSAQVAGLPLNGRTFITLATLAPGVSLPPNSLLPRINGGRPRTNEYLYDGISVLQPEPGQVAYFPVIDSIQEFRIENNSAPAEFGRFNGGVVNLTTKAGTNSAHGSVFEFFRHEALSARNFFQSANAKKPEYRRSQFGGTVGGPIVRSRTFFFADYQGQRQSIARTAISTVPTTLQREGRFTEAVGGRTPVIYDPASALPRAAFPDNRVPEERMDPVAVALLNRYPLPTSPGTANNYSRTANERDNQDQWSARLDHHLRAGRDRLFVRLSRLRAGFTPVAPLPDGSGVASGSSGPQTTGAWSFASGFQRTLSGSAVNELRVGDTRRAVRRSAARRDAPGYPAPGIRGIPSFGRFQETLPTVIISGYQQLGSPPSTAADFSTGVVQVSDAFTWLRGRHVLKFGADLRWARLDVVQPPSPSGSFTFSSLFTDQPGLPNTGTPLASFLLGQVQTFSIDLQRRPIQERAHVQEYFVQDDWMVSDRLTLNPGLRYTLNFPSTEINGQTAVFNLQTQQLDFPGRSPVRVLHKDNFGPRFGAVYRLSQQTIASAAYGLVWIEMTGVTSPFTTPAFPFLQTVSQRTLDNIAPAFVLQDGPTVAALEPTAQAGLGQGVFAVDRRLGSGYVQQWNASVQRDVSSHVTAEVAYLGSTITRVGIPDTNLNQLTTSQLSLGTALLERVPNPYFGVVPRSSSLGDPTIPLAQLLKPYPAYTTVSLYRNNVGRTFYQGVSASLRQRLSHGLTWSLAYTRSKLVDDASSVFDATVLTGPVANYPVADSFNRSGERDRSTGDIPHAFGASIMWDAPFGRGRSQAFGGFAGMLLNDWSLAALITLQSGTPIAVTQATNFNAFAGFGVQRPNIIGEAALPAGHRTVTRWFNTDAFTAAPPFTLGSASRNPVRGPSYRSVDLAVTRRVPFRRLAPMEVRVELFNLLNTPNFGAPAATFGAPGFGSITSALDPRVIQIAGRLTF